MDISINTTSATQSANNQATQNATGIAAPTTESQKADFTATRVTDIEEKAKLEENANNADRAKLDLIKQAARDRIASFESGENPFLSDVRFTAYNSEQAEFEIRFTDISTGQITTQFERELLAGYDVKLVDGVI